MTHVFITGISTSVKSYLAKRVAEKTNSIHVEIDKFRDGMTNDPALEPWVNFYWNQDETNYWKNTNPEEDWINLVKQSEALWPKTLKKINEMIKEEPNRSFIFEGVSMLPHLVKKDLDINGIVLLGESEQILFERLKKSPRWGETEDLQKIETNRSFNHERNYYKKEAEKYGYPIFDNANDAEEKLVKLLKQ